MPDDRKNKLRQGRIPTPPPLAKKHAPHWWQHANRYWMSHLSGNEWKVVSMILDRTLNWQKTEERISRKHLALGIVSRQGDLIHGGTGISESTLDTILKQLEAREVIIVRREHPTNYTTRTFYSLNRHWKPTSAKTRPQNSGRVTPDIGAPRPWNRGLKNQQGKLLKAQEDNQSSRTAPTGALERKKKAVKATLPSSHAIERAWKIALEEVFPGIPFIPFGVVERTNLKRLATRWTESHDDASFLDFIDWLVRNWRSLIQSEFGWIKDAPQFPVVAVVVKMFDRFLGAWRQRAEMKAKWNMPEREQAITRLTMRGVDRPIAEARIDEMFEKSDILSKIRKEQTKLHRTRIAFARQQEEALQTQARLRNKKPRTVLRPSRSVEPPTVADSEFGRYEDGDPAENVPKKPA